ncbi:MAG TPA: PA14 domain-containing protein [Planctomycetota bacterium]|nr:PA14 domain-containing protein [Planctomycetota bacterium]
MRISKQSVALSIFVMVATIICVLFFLGETETPRTSSTLERAGSSGARLDAPPVSSEDAERRVATADERAQQQRVSDRPEEHDERPESRRRGGADPTSGFSFGRRPTLPGSSPSTPTDPGRVAPVGSRTTSSSSSTSSSDQPDTPQGSGLTGTYVSFKSTLSKVPSLADLAATALTRLDPVIDFPASAPWSLNVPTLETFAATWTGYFYAPVAGHYAFTVGSHDGSVLTIDNKTVVSNDGLHAYNEGKGELDLAQGFHPIRLGFFINLVDEPGTEPVCRFLCAQPGQGLAICPTNLLFPSNGSQTAQLPQVASATPQGARRGQAVVLTGQNFGPTPDTNTVTFGPTDMPAVVQAASPTALTVLVPPGVDQGPIKVTVGDETAPAFPYTVGGNFGLDALFFRETDDVDVTSFLDTTLARTPDDEKILGPINLTGPGAFGIQFPAVRFRAELYGQIYIQNPGVHGFGLPCDAGARLLIDGQVVTNQVTLQQGWHRIQIDYYTNLAGAQLVLLHGDPGQPLAVCPRALLALPPEVDAQTPPTMTSIDHGTPLHVGDTITIHGTGLALGDGRLPRVMVRGIQQVVHAASPTTLVVEVFAGTLAGPLTVQVGPLVSAAVNLDIAPNPNLLTRSAAITRLAAGVPAPIIDGKGDDLAWQTVQPIGAFVPCMQAGQVATPLTQAFVTYDSQKLYVLVQCQEPSSSKMTIVGKRHEDAVYAGDSVDFFFSLGASAIPHAHIIVNPNDVTWTAMITRPYDFSGSTFYDGDHSWYPPFASAASMYDEGWSVELAVPWTSLGIACPQPGETHRVEIGRYRPQGPDFTCWSQTKQNFLEPDDYGTWTFQ